MEEEFRGEEAYNYAEKAAVGYQNVFSSDHLYHISSLWQKLRISYSLRKGNT
jgi:hypothetical protein